MTINKEIDAILWDIDGTLILTEELHFETVEIYCSDRNISLSDADNEAMLGKTMPEKWAYLRDVHEITDSESVFRDACAKTYRARLGRCELRPESLQVMSFASGKVSQACVSNGDRIVVQANIERLQIADLIEFALSCEDFEKGKPDPEPYLTACKRMGCEPSRCMVVEDSPVGVASAAAAGLTVVAWPDASSPFPTEAFRKAHYHIGAKSQFPFHLLGETCP